MKTVREILQNKESKVWSVSPDTTVFDALKLMAEKNIGSLIIMEGEKVAGIMSERDYARKVAILGKFTRETLVKEIMSSTIIYVNPSYHIDECMALMSNKRVRHLPVIDNDKLTGIISIGDVVKAVIDEKEFVIDQLVHYITGGHA